jgi:NitT/TauT family transport system ATP-binding protein
MEPPIVLTGVRKSYESPPVYVVHDFTLSVNRSEFFCLVGASGCGKSTVLKMIAGIECWSSGTIVKPDHIGMVFQSNALLPWLTVEDNVAFAARMQKFPCQKVKAVTAKCLKMVHLSEFAKKLPRELSGGMRQRVGIARALAVESDVLLMDEPFSALDPMICEELYVELLQIWRSTKKTIVMISHHFEEAVTLADRIGIMKEGNLKEILTIDLPRPRSEDDPNFMMQVKKTRSSLE